MDEHKTYPETDREASVAVGKISRRKLLGAAGAVAITGALFGSNRLGLARQGGRVTDSVYSLSTNCSEIQHGIDVEGAVGDGIADDSQHFLDAIQAASLNHIHVLKPKKKTYRITQQISIPSNFRIDFNGSTIIAPNHFMIHLFKLDGVERVTIENAYIKEEACSFDYTTGAAFFVSNARDIHFSNVFTKGFASGFKVFSAEGTENKNISFSKCRSEYSDYYGYEIGNSTFVDFYDCQAEFNYTDGFKLTKSTKNVHFVGGYSNHNGQIKVVDPTNGNNGNGVDAYAGGEYLTISDLTTNDNYGSGVYIKTGNLNEQGAALPYGLVTNIHISNLKSGFNLGSGSGLEFKQDVATAPVPTHVNVLGGIFEGNDYSGIRVANGRNINMIAPIIKNNNVDGIAINKGHDIHIIAPIVTANSQKTAGMYYGIFLGVVESVTIIGGVVNGADNEYLPNNDYTHLEKKHKHSIYVSSEAIDKVVIKNVNCKNNTETLPIRVNMSTGSCIVEYGKMTNALAWGGVGSTLLYNDMLYMKVSGRPSEWNIGWQPLSPKIASQPDSIATDVTALKNDFNALLVKLRNAKLM